MFISVNNLIYNVVLRVSFFFFCGAAYISFSCPAHTQKKNNKPKSDIKFTCAPLKYLTLKRIRVVARAYL